MDADMLSAYPKPPATRARARTHTQKHAHKLRLCEPCKLCVRRVRLSVVIVIVSSPRPAQSLLHNPPRHPANTCDGTGSRQPLPVPLHAHNSLFTSTAPAAAAVACCACVCACELYCIFPTVAATKPLGDEVCATTSVPKLDLFAGVACCCCVRAIDLPEPKHMLDGQLRRRRRRACVRAANTSVCAFRIFFCLFVLLCSSFRRPTTVCMLI